MKPELDGAAKSSESRTKDLLCCPRCGSEDGFYDISIQRFQFNYKWDGESDGATEPDEIRGGKRRYCQECDCDVTKKTKQYGAT